MLKLKLRYWSRKLYSQCVRERIYSWKASLLTIILNTFFATSNLIRIESWVLILIKCAYLTLYPLNRKYCYLGCDSVNNDCVQCNSTTCQGTCSSNSTSPQCECSELQFGSGCQCTRSDTWPVFPRMLTFVADNLANVTVSLQGLWQRSDRYIPININLAECSLGQVRASRQRDYRVLLTSPCQLELRHCDILRDLWLSTSGRGSYK